MRLEIFPPWIIQKKKHLKKNNLGRDPGDAAKDAEERLFLRLRGVSRTGVPLGFLLFPTATGVCPTFSLGLLGRRLLVSDNLKFLAAFPHFNFTLVNNFSRQQPSQ